MDREEEELGDVGEGEGDHEEEAAVRVVGQWTQEEG